MDKTPPEETQMILIVNSEAISVTYREAERIYRRLSDIFDTPTIKTMKAYIGDGGNGAATID